MTDLDELDDVATREQPAISPTEERPASGRKSPVRRLLSLVFLAVVVLVTASFVVEDPIAHVWYQARQQQLVSDFTKGHPTIRSGHALAVLQIPSINMNLTVVEGDGPGALRGGPGHRTHSPAPGTPGNSIVFGHRTGWGGPFSDLGKMKVNDNIFVKTRTGKSLSTLFFRVTSVRTASGSDRRPFAASSDRRLTLVTGSGDSRLSSDRLVVVAVSGNAGKLRPPVSATTSAVGPVGSTVAESIAIALVALLAGAAVVRFARRSHGDGVVGALVVPIFATALFGLVLAADLALPALG